MMPIIQLRDIIESDLKTFFEQQLDPEANYMAAFTAQNPADQSAFYTKWRRIRSDKKIVTKTILYQDRIAGHVLKFEQFGQPEVSYWLGHEFWGKGIATAALSQFLHLYQVRPLYARVAKDNVASICVLENCGFKICGEDKGYANARREEIEEYILQLS